MVIGASVVLVNIKTGTGIPGKDENPAVMGNKERTNPEDPIEEILVQDQKNWVVNIGNSIPKDED